MELMLEGRLEDSNLPKLMHTICNTKETGVLYLSNGGINTEIYIKGGNVIFAVSDNPDDRLGELLLKTGIITYSKLEEAVKRLGKGKRLGTILVESGFISPEALFSSVIEQVKQIVFSVFPWTEGEYRFEMGDLPSEEVITLRISTSDLILEGIKRIDKWSLIKDGLGNSLDATLKKADDYEARLSQITLTDGEKMLIDIVGGGKSMRKILEESRMDDFTTCQVLWALKVIGIIRLAPAAKKNVDEPEREHPSEEKEQKEETLVEAEKPRETEEAHAPVPAPEVSGEEEAEIDEYLNRLDGGAAGNERELPDDLEDITVEVETKGFEIKPEEEAEPDSTEDVGNGGEEMNVEFEEKITKNPDENLDEITLKDEHPPSVKEEPAEKADSAGNAAEKPGEPDGTGGESEEDPQIGLQPELTADIGPLTGKPEQEKAPEEQGHESAVALFNKRHRYLYKFLKSEIGPDAEKFVRTAISRLDAGPRRLFEGLHFSDDGSFPGKALLEQIHNLDLKFPGPILTRLIRKELEICKSAVSEQRTKIIEMGLKKIKPD